MHKVKKLALALTFLSLVLASLTALDPAHASLKAGTWAIEWDIGLLLQDPFPSPPSGGPGFRYSLNDTMALGLQMDISPLFMGAFKARTFFAWRFLQAPGSFPIMTGVLGLECLADDSGAFRLTPNCQLSLGYDDDLFGTYLSARLDLPIPDVPRFKVQLNGSIGAVLHQAGNLFLEFSLAGIGSYSSVNRNWVGTPALSVGMVNEF